MSMAIRPLYTEVRDTLHHTFTVSLPADSFTLVQCEVGRLLRPSRTSVKLTMGACARSSPVSSCDLPHDLSCHL